MSLIEKLKSVRNNGSRRQAHIDLACECIKEVELLETQLKASQDECEELKKMQDHLKWKDETRKQLKVSREEIDQLKAEVKKKKNRIGILNRSLRRLKKDK